MAGRLDHNQLGGGRMLGGDQVAGAGRSQHHLLATLDLAACLLEE